MVRIQDILPVCHVRSDHCHEIDKRDDGFAEGKNWRHLESMIFRADV
jgi:hypothetical protein